MAQARTSGEEGVVEHVEEGLEVDLSRVDPERMLSHLQALGRLPSPSPSQPAAAEPGPSQPSNQPNPADPLQNISLEAMFRQWMLSALTKTSEHAPPTASPSTTSMPGKSPLKFPDPPVFEGDPNKLEGWVTQTCMYLRAYDIDLASVRAVEVASMFLRGKALDWWSGMFQLVVTGQAQPLGSWDAFVKQLTDAFRPIELTRRYLKELLHISQGKSEMRTYIAAFNAARARVPGALSDDSLCYVFLQGCKTELQRLIVMQNPKTLEEHFSLAVSLADLSSSAGSSQSSKPGGKPGDKPTKPVCAHCKKPGHTIEQCFKLHPELKLKAAKKT